MPSRTLTRPSQRLASSPRHPPPSLPHRNLSTSTTTTTTTTTSIPPSRTPSSPLRIPLSHLFPTSPLLSTRLTLPLSNPAATRSNTIRAFSTSTPLAAPRNTYNPSRRVQKRRHGYLARLKTKSGRKILARRKMKGRVFLSW